MNASSFIIPVCILLLFFSCALSMTQDLELDLETEGTLASFGKTSPRIHKLIDNFHVMRTRRDQGVNVWVYFNDKGPLHNNDKHLRGIVDSMDPKTLWRRSTRGKHVVGHEDQPVYPSYVQQILDTGVELRQTSKWLNAISVTLEASSVDSLQDELRELVAHPFVKSVDVVASYSRKDVSQEKQENEQPAPAAGSEFKQKRNTNSLTLDDYGQSVDQLNQISVIDAHAAGYNGTGVLVMICDTGYRKTHPAMPMDRVLGEYDFVDNDDDTTATDIETHGTATMSNLGGWAPGQIIGSGFGAQFLLAKTEDSNQESRTEEDNFIRALEWGEERGIDLVSSSLGYTQWYTFADLDGKTAPISQACEAAIRRGVVVVISNGNTAAHGVSAPADAENVISVGAVEAFGAVASFSSLGPTADGRIKPEVCARGVQNYVASIRNNGYTTMSGTSFSCPLVAGVVAILLQAHPDWTPAMVKEALITTTRVSASGLTSPNNYYGYGIVDTMGALQATPREGNCEKLGCEGRGCCVNGQCQCSPDFYGRTCDAKRVPCSSFCQQRANYNNLQCLAQVSGKSYRCGLKTTKVDNTTYPVCEGCKKDLCGNCFGQNECVGCDGVAFSGAKKDQCGVCNGKNKCLSTTAPVPKKGSRTDRTQAQTTNANISSAYYYTIIAAVCFIGGLILASAILIVFTFMRKQAENRANAGFVKLPSEDNVAPQEPQVLMQAEQVEVTTVNINNIPQ